MLPEGRVALGDTDAAVARIASFIRRHPAIRPNERFTLRAMLDATMEVYECVAEERRCNG